MYSLVKHNGLRHILERELLPFVIALVIAQVYFKWGSFALELVGFIATWLVLGFVVERLLRATGR
ncbi:MAG: hypothetical protein IOD03_22410 [Methylocystis sp.]|jgi:hypothetical protein|uniref:hypothetical protein n=1 Tax=Phenylobacterium sp. TaxID=1871053 RepID=UPI0025E0F4D6|nr:hypothetical protein [Phenylobacterium sp.]MCA3468710.1 hypothetical protein [Rhodobacter sp.]MCA3586402.1 hypothetical protein [Methylocystis sp.]MCA3473799.1 hypothetical protein [Rhodobacter sp.]MCA3483918.1 hypothetical protein [Rhodobacter sp.]MCA3732134.1 hypothetical protein [Phenylobacterium sp.]